MRKIRLPILAILILAYLAIISDSAFAASSANIYAYVSTPGNVYLGNTIYAAITIINSGGIGTNVNVNPYVCRSDGSTCISMSCSSNQYSVYVNAYGSASLSCWSSANEYSYHSIRVDYNWGGYAQTVNSGQFDILSSAPCTAQYLNNYQCSGNVRQRQYQNSDCTFTWTNVETCSYGCSNGVCQPGNCVGGYTGNYQCSGNARQREYKRYDCAIEWHNIETCSHGCSNGNCVSYTYYSSQYLNNYRCDGNWKQQQYQHSDGSTTWNNMEYCSNGCSNGFCNYYYNYYYQPSCSSIYTNNYQCSGAMRQRQYQNSDCSLTWYNVETCLYGCSNGFCSSPPLQTGISIPSGCDLSISMNYDATLQKGLSAVVSGYVKDQNGNFLRIPFKFYAGDEFVVEGKSNEFGYWQAGFTPTTTGKKEFRITIPSCNVKKTGEITVVENIPLAKAFKVDVYPASIDTKQGEDSLLVIDSDAEDVQVKIDGVPKGWLNPVEFVIKDEKSYVHINPADAAPGIYELNITGYSDGRVAFNRKVSFFVSRKAFFGAQEDGRDWTSIAVSRILDLSGLIALVIIAYVALILYNRGYRISLDVPRLRNKQTYLNDVKRKIEQDVVFE